MTPYTLLAGASTVIVGGGIAAGLGFALKPSSNSANQESISSQGRIAPPTQTNFSNNYLVTAQRSKPNNLTATTCTLGSTCQLFSLHAGIEITADQIANIFLGNRYVLNINNTTLKKSSLVEVVIDGENKKYFAVQSAPSVDKTKAIQPIAPSIVIAKKDLLAQESVVNGIVNNQVAIQNKRYYNEQQDSYVERGAVDHDAFLVFKWDTNKYPSDFYTDSTDNATVDKYLFKSFEEQLKDKGDGIIGQLKVSVNGDEHDLLVEIYEIKDQQAVKVVFDTFTNKTPISNTALDWDKISKESLMITKLSQLKADHYYKFVFSDFEKLISKFRDRILDIEIRQQISTNNKQRLLKTKSVNDQYHCIKFPSSGNDSKVCRKFASS